MGENSQNPDDEFFDDEAFHLDGLSNEEKSLLATLLRSEIDPDEIDFAFSEENDVPFPIPTDFADRLSDRVMKSIQAGDLGAELLKFGTVGLARACLSLLGPAFSLQKNEEENNS